MWQECGRNMTGNADTQGVGKGSVRCR